MTPHQQVASQSPCRHPLEMSHAHSQRLQVLDHMRYSITITVQWGGGIFLRQPVWYAYVTVLGPLGSRQLHELSASVRQRTGLARQGLDTLPLDNPINRRDNSRKSTRSPQAMRPLSPWRTLMTVHGLHR